MPPPPPPPPVKQYRYIPQNLTIISFPFLGGGGGKLAGAIDEFQWAFYTNRQGTVIQDILIQFSPLFPRFSFHSLFTDNALVPSHIFQLSVVSWPTPWQSGKSWKSASELAPSGDICGKASTEYLGIVIEPPPPPPLEGISLCFFWNFNRN